MKPRAPLLPRFALSALVALVLVGCVSMEEQAAKRREQLLAAYPPGKTTRADIQQTWTRPNLSATRPTNGWSAFTPSFVGHRVGVSEQRTGRTVHHFDRYLAPDGISGGLCLLWFYYDEHDKLVDTEWQWHTD
jgi:hypothetical protein